MNKNKRMTKILMFYKNNKESCTIEKISKGTGIPIGTVYENWKKIIDCGIVVPELPYCQIYDMEGVKKIYFNFKNFRECLKQEGVRRLPNMPEYISEGLVAVLYNGIDSNIGDLKIKNKEIEVKSTTLIDKDCTSFSPNNKNKDIYFISFDLELDKYKIFILEPSVIDNCSTNKKQTVKQTREQGKRPRLSLLDYIKENQIQPDKSGVI